MENKYKPYRIVVDSAADLFRSDCVSFSATPLKVITDEKNFAI